ncbi:hypothetical protein KPH14_012894, partial [Odynerus spinipes]
MPNCKRVFPTSRGRGVHEQKAHKDWYDEQLSTKCSHQKAPWSAEELALLARLEANLTLQGQRLINVALVASFPNRTLEAIKGQRRDKKYKDSVQRYIREIEESRHVNPDIPDNNDNSINNPNNTLLNEMDTALNRLDTCMESGFHAEHLNKICKNLKVWPLERVKGELETYLIKTFPPMPRSRRPGNDTRDMRHLTRRKLRRVEYALTQRAWNKNPCNCLRKILKDKTSNQAPNKDTMVPYWTAVMTAESNTSPGTRREKLIGPEVWAPVTPNEIKAALPGLSTSPGPDGLTARQLRAMPTQILTRIFNLFLLCGSLPRHLLESRTVLIPKKDNASDPAEFRPITISSVMTRAFHKVLANRLLLHCNLDRRQKAFV